MSQQPLAGLSSADELFRTAFDVAPIGMCLIAPDGRFLQVNDAICKMMGYSQDDLLRLRVADVTHPDDRGHNLKLLTELVSGTIDRYELRKTNLKADGTPIPVLVTVAAVRDGQGQLLYIVAQLQDLTRQLDSERALREVEASHRLLLERQARHDLLTGLPNRRDAWDRLTTALAGGELAPGGGVAVLFCDLDDFKAVNDTQGHAAGDDLLIAVAERLRLAARPGETVCRFGGDEFVVLAPGAGSLDEAMQAAGRFAATFATPFVLDGREFPVTVSIGVVFAPAGTHPDGQLLIRDADIAMYRAKAQGRNRVIAFTDTLRQELMERVELEGELRQALGRGELVLHYQPIFNLRAAPLPSRPSTSGIERLEALVRWQHPRRGLLPPGVFLPLVDRGGLAPAMGLQVLAQATAQAAAWHHSGLPGAVAVNLAAAQVQPPLAAAVTHLLAAHDLPADRLTLELTETALLETHTENLAVLHALADQGVRLAVDDFGTGYSSFAYLRDLPIHEVKLDRSFIRRLDEDARTRRVVAGMIHLAHELGLEVVAEGVELPSQLERLQRLDCDLVQGFLFARPSADPFAAGV